MIFNKTFCQWDTWIPTTFGLFVPLFKILTPGKEHPMGSNLGSWLVKASAPDHSPTRQLPEATR